jgi:hypothetical protein
MGELNDVSELPTYGELGQAYLINGHIFIYTGGATLWEDIGSVLGDQGPTGPTGGKGPTGPTGSTGSTGAEGAIGNRGEQGNQGPAGPQGDKGEQGNTGPSVSTVSPTQDAITISIMTPAAITSSTATPASFWDCQIGCAMNMDTGEFLSLSEGDEWINWPNFLCYGVYWYTTTSSANYSSMLAKIAYGGQGVAGTIRCSFKFNDANSSSNTNSSWNSTTGAPTLAINGAPAGVWYTAALSSSVVYANSYNAPINNTQYIWVVLEQEVGTAVANRKSRWGLFSFIHQTNLATRRPAFMLNAVSNRAYMNY